MSFTGHSSKTTSESLRVTLLLIRCGTKKRSLLSKRNRIDSFFSDHRKMTNTERTWLQSTHRSLNIDKLSKFQSDNTKKCTHLDLMMSTKCMLLRSPRKNKDWPRLLNKTKSTSEIRRLNSQRLRRCHKLSSESSRMKFLVNKLHLLENSMLPSK
jgi:hypothetical protein